jgi:DNA invertase Pin-like site-specific DNA recombinase
VPTKIINTLADLGASNSAELLEILERYQEQGIAVESLAERSVIDILQFTDKLDKAYRSERQRNATKKAYDRGNLKGKKSTMDNTKFVENLADYRRGKITLVEFGRRMGREAQTIRKAIKKYEQIGHI